MLVASLALLALPLPQSLPVGGVLLERGQPGVGVELAPGRAEGGPAGPTPVGGRA